jgi:hypothetical protein
MALGNLLLAKNILNPGQLDTALEHQRIAGGLLGDNLISLGFITRERLSEILLEPPAIPRSITDTGLETHFLINSVLKSIYVSSLQTVAEISDQIRLSRGIIEELLTIAKRNGLLEVQGSTDASFTALKYALTGLGREQAIEALRWCQYTGPIPVPLADYQFQVQKQTVTNERIDAEAISRCFSHLVLPEDILHRLGPAVNSGKALLLYGGSGNGKTSIAESVGKTFTQPIYIPFSIYVDGQIIKLFDPAVHRELPSEPSSENNHKSPVYLQQADFDPRWVHCYRPVITSGGELTLEMLDLEFDPMAKHYEAPLQVKATGGVFIIDDFGRQLVRPQDLLNRWIIPLERRVDYLTLHTGKKFELPFDQLVVFSTNIPPEDLMDVAFLRRIHYKLRIDPPTADDYKTIFRRVCEVHKLEVLDHILSYLLTSFYPKNNVIPAAFHPKFIVEHAISVCNYEGVPPRLTLELVRDALANLITTQSPPHLGSNEKDG